MSSLLTQNLVIAFLIQAAGLFHQGVLSSFKRRIWSSGLRSTISHILTWTLAGSRSKEPDQEQQQQE